MAESRILVLGATGGTGREVVAQALQAGHEVTALMHRPERTLGPHARLRLVAGDVLADGPALSDAIRGQEVVISALGRGYSFRSRGLIEGSMPRILAAMERHGVTRLVVTSAYGVGETWRDVPAVPRLFVRLLLWDLYADKARGEAVLRQSPLDWTLVYPVALTNGPRTGRHRAGERLSLVGLPSISRADVAAFLLTQVEDRRFIRKGVLITGA